MSKNTLLDFFEECDESEHYESLKAPFVWVGGKGRSLDKILPHLPHRARYVEPFGGSMTVLLGRSPSKIEVYNDRYSGLVDFYRCLRDPALLNRLIERLEMTCHSREMFDLMKEERDSTDPIIRAAAWYYIQETSFGGVGRNYGRAIGSPGFAGKLKNKLPLFPAIHERIQNVQIENLDWRPILKDWDSEDTVFYIDPPYTGTDNSMYKDSNWQFKDLVELLNTIFNLEGYVAFSGYPLAAIDNFPWDDRVEWEVSMSVKSVVNNERNNRSEEGKRFHSTEVLWIKH